MDSRLLGSSLNLRQLVQRLQGGDCFCLLLFLLSYELMQMPNQRFSVRSVGFTHNFPFPFQIYARC